MYKRRRIMRRRIKRRPNRRRGRRMIVRPSKSLSVGPPQYTFVKLRYTDLRQASLAGAAQDVRQWRINNIYDPDLTGVGGQPYYFDQYINMYQHYKVYGMKLEWRFTCVNSASGYQPIIVAVPIYGSTFWGTDYITAMEKKGAVWRTPVSGQNSVTIKKYYSCADIVGLTKKDYATNLAFQGENAATPPAAGNQCYLNLIVQNTDALASCSFSSVVRLTYYVRFSAPQQPVGS